MTNKYIREEALGLLRQMKKGFDDKNVITHIINGLIEELDCMILIAQHHEFIARNLKIILKEKENV